MEETTTRFPNLEAVLQLYDIEARKIDNALDRILRIRGMIAVAFTALLSAMLFYRQGVLALGGFIFLAAWYWEYIYAMYLRVYQQRVDAIQVWISTHLASDRYLSQAYLLRYDHRIVDKGLGWIAQKLRRPRDQARIALRDRVGTFLDLPRATAYTAMSIAPIIIARWLGLPWISP